MIEIISTIFDWISSSIVIGIVSLWLALQISKNQRKNDQTMKLLFKDHQDEVFRWLNQMYNGKAPHRTVSAVCPSSYEIKSKCRIKNFLAYLRRLCRITHHRVSEWADKL